MVDAKGLNYPMRGSRKFCQRRSNFDKVFFVSLMRGGRIQISHKHGGNTNFAIFASDRGGTA